MDCGWPESFNWMYDGSLNYFSIDKLDHQLFMQRRTWWVKRGYSGQQTEEKRL